MPSSCGMFVYSDVTSAVTKIAFSGRVGRIQEAVECVCSLGCMRRVSPQEVV